MKKLSLEDFNLLVSAAEIRPRIAREIRFIPRTKHLTDEDWASSELLAVSDRSGNKGVLVISLEERYYVVPYEISAGITSSTGRAQPIICDFCRTWQTGGRSGSITFRINRDGDSIGYLCCSDLLCSQHVRSKTLAARTSRSQLREDLVDEQRVERLRTRLEALVKQLHARPIQLESL